MSNSLVSIVVLNYNGKELLKKFLPGIKANLIANSELVIADNASTDNSQDWIKKNYPDLKLICLEKNYGFAEGYNQALKEIESKYFLLLNSDVEIKGDFLNPLIECIESDNKIASVQAKILAQKNPEYFEYAGAAGGMMDKWFYPFCRGRIFDHCEKDKGQYDDRTEIFWSSGAAMLVRADLYKSFGGLDKDFFAHVEEIDLCWRFKNAGYKIMVEPKSVVYHLGGATLAYQNPRKTFLNFRNSYYSMFKNERGKKLLWLFPLRLLLDGLAALRFLSKGDFKNIVAIIKAHWAVFLSVGRILDKRKKTKAILHKNRVGTRNANSIFGISIIWQHFINKKNRFDQINGK